jgi:hypothetical protein
VSPRRASAQRTVVFERGGYRRLIVERIVYKEFVKDQARQTDDSTGGRTAAAPAEKTFRIVTAPMPKEIVPRGILAPSMIAHVLAIKYVWGVPFYRYEHQCAREGFSLDRGTGVSPYEGAASVAIHRAAAARVTSSPGSSGTHTVRFHRRMP